MSNDLPHLLQKRAWRVLASSPQLGHVEVMCCNPRRVVLSDLGRLGKRRSAGVPVRRLPNGDSRMKEEISAAPLGVDWADPAARGAGRQTWTEGVEIGCAHPVIGHPAP